MRRGKCWTRAAVAMGIVAASVPAAAHDVVAGWEGGSGRGYAFVAPSWHVAGDAALSWHARASLSHLYYEFSEAGSTTRVRSPGQFLGLALRHSTPGLAVSIGGGYEERQTRRRTVSGERKVRERGAVIDGNMFLQAAPGTVLSLLASYGEANEYFWTRAGIKHALANSGWHAGLELTAQGNDDVKARQAGTVIELAFPRSQASLQFRVGYSRRENPDGTRESEPYIGIGFYRAF